MHKDMVGHEDMECYFNSDNKVGNDMGNDGAQFAEKCDMVVNGYGFLFNDVGNVLCIDLYDTRQRCKLEYPSLNVLSTTMDGINLDIAIDLIKRNIRFFGRML